MLASVADNDKHAKLMQKYPDMEHDDTERQERRPGKSADILWRFSKGGTFEFALPDPRPPRGRMHGTVSVK